MTMRLFHGTWEYELLTIRGNTGYSQYMRTITEASVMVNSFLVSVWNC